MGNRFYIPNNRENPVTSGINTGLNLVSTMGTLKNQQEQIGLQKGQLDLARQKAGIESRRADVELGVPGQEGLAGEGTIRQSARLQELQVKAEQQQQDREDAKFQQSVQKANTAPKAGDIDGLEAMIPSISKQLFVPSIEKTSKTLFANVRKLAEQGLTRREIKDAMASSFSGSYNQVQMIEGAKKDLAAAFEQYGPESPQAQSAKQTLDAISDGSILSSFFPSVAAVEMAEKRAQEAELVKAMASKRQPGLIERTIDLGNKQRVIYNDGTVEDMPKAASPSTIVMADAKKPQDEMAMRKEFQALPEVKDFPVIESQIGRLEKAMGESKKDGSKVAVDQALITILNKMLDPASVVRESEYARTQADMSFLNRIRGKFDKLKEGGAGLTNEEREAIARMARQFGEVAKTQYDAQVGYYSDLATRYGHNPENVIRLGGKKETPKEDNQGGWGIKRLP